jgi:uncharacterized protein DUF4926/uncharacterized protein DUF6883
LQIPNADRAVIDPRKLHGYLLSRSHQVGRFKAEFFLALGYSPEDWRRLEADLRSQHLPKDATAEAHIVRAEVRDPRYAGRASGEVGGRRERLVRASRRRRPQVRDGLSGGQQLMTYQLLDTIVLDRDVPEHGLRKGDLGAIVEVYDPDAFEVEFVTASGKTAALLTLNARDLRPVADDDLVSVRPCRRLA